MTDHDKAPPARAVALREAAKLIEDEVLPTLNTKSERCGTCNTKHFERFEDVKANDELYGVVTKLRRWANAFDAAPPQPGDEELRMTLEIDEP